MIRIKIQRKGVTKMALIKCPECGKEISDKASACPNCGCPVSVIPFQTLPSEVDIPGNTAPVTFRASKKVGPIQIDENNRLFRIYGAIPTNKKKTGLVGATFKGMMAVSTMGMSIAAEKALGLGKTKVGSKSFYSFNDLISYELIEDDSLVTSGGVGQALIGGAVFGGFGAVAGGITAKRTQKKKIESLYIKVTLNDFSNPCIMIPLVTKPTKTTSSEYKNAFTLSHQILSVFDVITHNK